MITRVTKICRTCKAEKPISEFYDHLGTKDGFLGDCKECAKAKTKYYYVKHTNAKSVVSGCKTENRAIEKLKSVGIYAVSGKASEFKRCDVVAWGCIKIEVKTSSNRDGSYLFGFTPTQRNQGLQADFVLLVCGDIDTFHLFPVTHPVFYLSDGKLKSGVAYTPSCESPKNRTGYISLTDSLMTFYKDAWEQIEVKRIEIANQLRD